MSIVLVCESVSLVFFHGIRAGEDVGRTLDFGVSILQVDFEGFLVRIWP